MQRTYMNEHLEELKELTAETRVPVTLSGWSVCFGVPSPGWENVQDPQGQSFALDACIDLDTLSPETPRPNQSECVVYGTIHAQRKGICLFGLGADWWLQAYCNGVLVEDTFVSGNEVPLVMADNHRVFCPVEAGENRLAVRIRRGTSSWNFACSPYLPFELPPLPVLTYGPWLSDMDSAGKVTVNFCCGGEIGAGVEYRQVGESDWHTAWHQRHGQILRREFHRVELSGVTPGAEYEYRIICIHPCTFLPYPLTEPVRFTLPAAEQGRISFFFTADLQFGLDEQKRILKNMLTASAADKCDFFCFCGDINSSFQPQEVISGPLEQMQEWGVRQKPVYYIRGNHELRGSNGDRFLDYFASREGLSYFMFRFGATAFLALDSFEDKPSGTPGHSYCKWNLDDLFWEEQTRWLAGAMEREPWLTARRRIVLCHDSAFSHGDGFATMCPRLHRLIEPYFLGEKPRFKIDLWLTGHRHAYERSYPFSNEVTAPRMLMKPYYDGRECPFPVLTVAGPSSFHETPQASCFRLDVNDNNILIQSWDGNGTVLEKVILGNDGEMAELVGLPHMDIWKDGTTAHL